MPLNLESRIVQVGIATLAAAAVSLALPLGNLWLKCRRPESEACVWAKAYLPLSLGLTFVILGIPVFIVTILLVRHFAATRPG